LGSNIKPEKLQVNLGYSKAKGFFLMLHVEHPKHAHVGMFWVFVAPFPTSTPEMRPKVRVSGVGWLSIASPPSPSALARKMRQ